ncbi:MAG TPA: GNAT family N-acetyltransferase [Acidimicrobiales bacterium]|nr:GNAT family N-acetyltransferase [Acidimicrobiales bacterium]
MTRRTLPGGYELDDDPARIDVDAVHRYLSGESYWASARARPVTERLVREATRVVGLYRDGELVGFCRAVSDHATFAYLADVYVLARHRGDGRGVALVEEMVANGPLAGLRWFLRTADAHGLYERFGFGPATPETMERPPPWRETQEGERTS